MATPTTKANKDKEKPPTAPQTKSIKANPADNLAKMVLAAGSAGSIALAMRDILKNLPPSCRSRNTLNAAGVEYAKECLLKKHQGAIVAMEALLTETRKVAQNKVNLIDVLDTTELYAAGNGKTASGNTIETLEEVQNEAAIFTNDVLQQTPQLPDYDVDQCHFEHTREQRPTNRNAAGVWNTHERQIDEESTLEVKTPKGFFTYVVQKEEVTISVKPLDVVVQDDLGRPAAIIDQEDFAILGGEKMNKKIAYNTKHFKRTGLFGTADLAPRSVEFVTPKIDGEPMYIRCDSKGKSFGFDRKGSRYKITITGRFERAGRRGRGFKLLTEWVPSIKPGAEVFITQMWQFGTPNNIGLPYTLKVMKNKQISMVWESGIYKYDLKRKVEQLETTVPLLLPVFGKRSDGLVVHKGMSQRFLKPYKTVDIKKQSTYDVLTRDYRCSFDKMYPNVVCEFSVSIWDGRIKFKFVKYRKDKDQENDIDNIIDLITNADFDTWFDELDERFEEGELVRPEGWGKYRRFLNKRDKNKHTIYDPLTSDSGEDLLSEVDNSF
jgi:hypothetical protein